MRTQQLWFCVGKIAGMLHNLEERERPTSKTREGETDKANTQARMCTQQCHPQNATQTRTEKYERRESITTNVLNPVRRIICSEKRTTAQTGADAIEEWCCLGATAAVVVVIAVCVGPSNIAHVHGTLFVPVA